MRHNPWLGGPREKGQSARISPEGKGTEGVGLEVEGVWFTLWFTERQSSKKHQISSIGKMMTSPTGDGSHHIMKGGASDNAPAEVQHQSSESNIATGTADALAGAVIERFVSLVGIFHFLYAAAHYFCSRECIPI